MMGMTADLIHHGHINLIKRARKLGDLIIGVLSDNAIQSYKRKPVYNYKQRKLIVENIKGVKKVVTQKTLDYIPILEKINPDIVVHGDDWRKGVQKETREKVIEFLKKKNGKLKEYPRTRNISTTMTIRKLKKL